MGNYPKNEQSLKSTAKNWNKNNLQYSEIFMIHYVIYSVNTLDNKLDKNVRSDYQGHYDLTTMTNTNQIPNPIFADVTIIVLVIVWIIQLVVQYTDNENNE